MTFSFYKYLKLCLKKQNVEFLIKNEDRNKVKYSNFEKEYENELGARIDGVENFSTQLKELKRKLSVYTSYRRELKSFKNDKNVKILNLTQAKIKDLELNKNAEVKFVQTILNRVKLAEDSVKSSNDLGFGYQVLVPGGAETKKYEELDLKIQAVEDDMAKFVARTDIETDFTRPIKNILSVMNEVPKLPQYQVGWKKNLEYNIHMQLMEEYLPVM